MKPVLENGDVVLVNRIVYNATTPKRGDIIVFRPRGNENSHYYIKRIVGLPGETVEILENRVYINGEKLEEDYDTTDIDDVGLLSEPMELASDEYFVLGDDRENSGGQPERGRGKCEAGLHLWKSLVYHFPLEEFRFHLDKGAAVCIFNGIRDI